MRSIDELLKEKIEKQRRQKERKNRKREKLIEDFKNGKI